MRALGLLLAMLCLLFAVPAGAGAEKAPPPPGAVAAVALDSSGGVTLLARQDNGRPALVARYGADGRLDPAFAVGGVLALPTSTAGALAVAADGSLAVGSTAQSDHLVPGIRFATSGQIRGYTTAGAPDPGFGGDGAVELRGGAIERLFFQSSGRLVALASAPCRCGYPSEYLYADFFAPAGLPVRRAVVGGELFELQAAALAADGSVIAIGQIRDLRTSLLYRFLPDARLDPRLGGREGFPVYPDNPNYDLVAGARDLAVAPGEAIYLATRRGLSRRRPDGRADRRFGGGLVNCEGTRPRYGEARMNLVAVAPGGAVLGAGGPGRCGVARYLADGRPDPSFGSGGRVDVEALGFPRPQALAVQTDGSVLVAGWDAATSAAKLVRFTPAGLLDLGFGSGGVATLPAPVAD